MSAEYSTLHETVADPISCPRCEIDVYSLGIFIEDYLINTFMELARRNKNQIIFLKPWPKIILLGEIKCGTRL